MSSFINIPLNCDFSYSNLPYGVFSRTGYGDKHIGVAIGQYVLDLYFVSSLIDDKDIKDALKESSLNKLMSLGHVKWQELRSLLKIYLGNSDKSLKDCKNLHEKYLIPLNEITMHMPVNIGDYTDFYSSIDHAKNVGTMFRGKDNALMPNWKHIPVGYHGRASSVVVSNTSVRRPQGQKMPIGATDPVFGPSKRLDFELEMAFFTGPGNELGEPIRIHDAHKHIFGVVFMNDWSARDLQKWEYVPLGPFLAKNFATTISPWVVPIEALMPFAMPNPTQDPKPFPYLTDNQPFTFDVKLQVKIKPQKSSEYTTICESNMKHLYWTMKQQLAHHTISGCNIRPGDLLASGTISGPEPESFGSMLELSWNGTKPITLKDGSCRTFIEDGDEVVIEGFAETAENGRVGFGSCSGLVMPCKEVN